ncbi:MerR family transcriptional regulator [Sphaerotilus montanus]|uniref:MerR family transcriptional regulator n=1 Tax=Sphaerotilus montanus TaxID=522889 RepID=UPI003FA3286E
MNDRAPAALHMLTIAAVERDTRIGKDTLRVWERRYGFPAPLRDSNGERLYPLDQVEQLRHIKRLLDAGWRPGRVVGLPLQDLQAIGDLGRGSSATALPRDDMALSAEPQVLYTLLRAHDVPGLRRALMQSLLRRGLGHFVGEVVTPLLVEIGQAWSRGQLAIFEEHLCSETIETVLRSAIASAPEALADGAPRVLLTTFPDEQHGLALLMAEALFTVEGCACMNLGRQTPVQDMVLAAHAHRAQVVVLSFSSLSPVGSSLDHLADLRAQLPDPVEIWAGTPQAAMLRRGVAGVTLLDNLAQIHTEVARWRAAAR